MKLELDAPAKNVPVLKLQRTGAPSLTTGKKALASNWFQKSDTYAPDKAVDGDVDPAGFPPPVGLDSITGVAAGRHRT